MISTFNLDKLHDLLKDFYTLTKIRITVFDDSFKELIAYPADISPVCQIIRMDATANENCINCDKHACETSAQRRTSYTYHCHAGLTESIMPIHLGNIVIGYLFFGHVFPYKTHHEGWISIKEKCADYKIDFFKLKKTIDKCPISSEEYIVSASHILQAVASYLCLERMVSIKQKDLSIQLDEYITEHFTENIDAGTICNHFQIGKTHLYELAKQNYGVGIASHIRSLRIEKAKKLLRDSDLRVSDISSECGFNDYNYFIAVFKKTVGTSPRQYRYGTANAFSSPDRG